MASSVADDEKASLGPSVPESPNAFADDDREDVMPLSKTQQKKRLLHEARQQRKGQKKSKKQTDTLDSALSSLHSDLSEIPGIPIPEASNHAALDGLLCTAFGVVGRYSQIPLAYGPAPEAGIAALESAVIRSPKYNAKFLPQEYSLLHKAWTLLGCDDGDGRGSEGAGIIDIGAGNANCAVFAAALLGITVICIERESPRPELRAELLMPTELKKLVIRIESDIEDFSVAALQELAAAHGLRRIALMAKHPCGIGVDRSIECASRLLADSTEGNSFSLVGLVIATCCTHKLTGFYAGSATRVPEFCGFYAKSFAGIQPGPALHSALETMSRCSSWRTAAGSLGNAIHEDQQRWAELFEDAVQALRLRRLKELFGDAAQIRFAPRESTLQDRCLIAAAAPLPIELWSHGSHPAAGSGADFKFVTRLRVATASLLASSGPIDCRPKGLKSAKFEFDYTDDNPPDE